MLDFYEVNRKFFTQDNSEKEQKSSYLSVLRKIYSLSSRAEKPHHALSQVKMFTNDIAKIMTKFDVDETIEVLSRTTKVYETLKTRDPLPNGLLTTFAKLFQVDESTGAS